MELAKRRYNNVLSNHILTNPEDMLIKYNNALELNINKLELLNPLNVLKKGYSVLEKDNTIIRSINDIKIKDNINIKLIDGHISATVKGVENNGK